VLLGIAAGVVLTCLILAGIILAVGDKATAEPKEQQAEPARARGRRASRKSTASAGTSSPVKRRAPQKTTEEKGTLPAPVIETTGVFAEPEETISESEVETPALPERTLEKAAEEKATLAPLMTRPLGTVADPEPVDTKAEVENAVLPKPMLRVEDLLQKEQPSKRLPRQAPPAITPIDITELRIDPAEAKPGEAATVSFKATNMNDFPCYYSVTLRVNGEVVSTQGLSLRRRASLPMSFTVSRSTPGDYVVEVNDSIGRFTILGGNF